MVSPQKALMASGGSAIAIGLILYVASTQYNPSPVSIALVGALSVFIIGYVGMSRKQR